VEGNVVKSTLISSQGQPHTFKRGSVFTGDTTNIQAKNYQIIVTKWENISFIKKTIKIVGKRTVARERWYG
jgi:hypothetical protein